jgi:single-strand DNA-binding protein
MQVKIGNSVMICGSLPRDAEFKRVGDKDTPLCKFGVKVDEREVDGQRQAVWCNCVCWRDVAIATYELQKGDVVLAIGKIQERSYTGRDGEERTSKELVCEAVFSMRQTSVLESFVSHAQTQGVNIAVNPEQDFEEIPDDELPF